MDTIIEKLEKLDNELYRLKYNQKNETKAKKLWNCIKGDKKILELATGVVKNKWGDKDTFLAPVIVEQMLIDYQTFLKKHSNQLCLFEDSVDNSLYQDLVNKIYSNTDLARIVLDGYSNGGYSFLLYTLLNDNLKLTDEQKSFAMEEAMNKIGTIKYVQQMEKIERKLEKKGITDDIDVIAPEIGLIGAKTYNVVMTEMLSTMSTNQAHGIGEFDIRYHILKNQNFINEMPKLVYDFFAKDEDYDEMVDCWKWDIVNRFRNNDDNLMIDIDEILFLIETEINEGLLKEHATEIRDEVNFIKKLHEIRPAGYRHLDEYQEVKILIKK